MGGKPSAPKPKPNYALMQEAKETRIMQITARGQAKQARLEDAIGRYGNRFGRASLMSGMATGVGFAAPAGRAVFHSNGA